jgi:hypothetical protein
MHGLFEIHGRSGGLGLAPGWAPTQTQEEATIRGALYAFSAERGQRHCSPEWPLAQKLTSNHRWLLWQAGFPYANSPWGILLAMPEDSATPDPVERVRGQFEAGNRRDIDAVMSNFAVDAVFDGRQRHGQRRIVAICDARPEPNPSLLATSRQPLADSGEHTAHRAERRAHDMPEFHDRQPTQRPAAPLRQLSALTAVDDVVDLKDFGLTGIDPQLAQDRRKPCPECVQLLLGVPNLADPEVAV